MTNIDDIQGGCDDCAYFKRKISVGDDIGYCRKVESEHYGHFIREFHPCCDLFEVWLFTKQAKIQENESRIASLFKKGFAPKI